MTVREIYRSLAPLAVSAALMLAGSLLFSCSEESDNGTNPDPADTNAVDTTDTNALTCPGTPSQPYAVLYPNGGESLLVGQTITVRICTADSVNYPIADERRPSLWLSVDDGKSWLMVEEFISEPSYEWSIPATLPTWSGGEVSLVSRECRIRTEDYYTTDIGDNSDTVFTIAAQ